MVRFSDELDTIQFALETPTQIPENLNDDLKLSTLGEKEREYILEMSRNLTLLKIIMQRLKDRCKDKDKKSKIQEIMVAKEKDYLREINLICVTSVNKKDNHALNLLFGNFNNAPKHEEEVEEDIVKNLLGKARKRRKVKNTNEEDDDE